MFVDASAICAILLDETDMVQFVDALSADGPKSTSPMAIWESAIVVSKRFDLAPSDAATLVHRLLDELGVAINPVPPQAADLAVEAFERFGKGRHPAALNFGDCFSYALARHLSVPLLFKGEDFARTDVEAARFGD